MSQAQVELVARATDPNADLTTLHTLAQNYPGLRPYIAENPRTYPALLEWLGTLGDPAVDAALARRAAGGAVDAVASGAAATQMLPSGMRSASIAPGQATVALPSQAAGHYAPGAHAAAVPPTSPSPAAGHYPPGAHAAGAATSAMSTPAWTQFSAPAQFPAQREQTVFGVGQAEEDQPSRRAGTIWLAVLGAIALLLVVALAVWFFMGGKDQPSGTPLETSPTQVVDADHAADQPAQAGQEATPTPSPTPSATPSASPTPTPTPTNLRYPAPADAITLSSFTSPSGNINCTIDSEVVTCTIIEHDFIDSSCGADNSLPFTIVLEANGTATASCTYPAVGGAGATLNYGSAAQNGQMACTSSENGVECWSQVTGETFTVNRAEAYGSNR